MIAPLGVIQVVTPGTPVWVMSLFPVGERGPKAYNIHAFFFQPLPTNTGFVYVGDEQMDKDTLVKVYAWLPAPTTNSAPAFSGAHTIAPNGLTLNQFWIDADVAGEGVLVTIMRT